MCREILDRTVINKFNEVKKWDCDSLESLERRVDEFTGKEDR